MQLLIKVFFLTITVGSAILYILPADEFGAKCGSKNLIPFVVILLMALLPFIAMVIERLKKGISKTFFFLASLLLFTLMIVVMWIILDQGCTLCAHSWTNTLADMRQMHAAQEMFYEKNKRYADTQEELINEVGIFTEKFKNTMTGEEFADKDGKGIEGGDNDPETWSAITYIFPEKFDGWCRRIEEGYWYICDQEDCYKQSEKDAVK
ncbi:MAG: hypothetical protein ABIB55_00150 [Candidatus Nealsonbacteria bacterium]